MDKIITISTRVFCINIKYNGSDIGCIGGPESVLNLTDKVLTFEVNNNGSNPLERREGL